jgi:2-polyprenyl-3-methyl-5-hydroxy-6-metoxy-1,4-benzoquinol methylase
MDNYAGYAEYYDALSFDEFSQQCVDYLEDLLSQLRCQGKTVLDLACGTGTAAILMAKQGYQVTGVDISAAMIRIAKRKAKQAGLPVRFFRQDMHEFNLQQKVELVTCFFDAMNHIYTYTDFAKVCKNVSRVLQPSGMFIFDLNTEFGLKHNWADKRTELKKNNLHSIFVSTYSARKRLAVVEATLQISKGSKTKTISSRFANRAYTSDQVYRALKHAGLVPVAEYDCFTLNPVTKISSRIMYLARKQYAKMA